MKMAILRALARAFGVVLMAAVALLLNYLAGFAFAVPAMSFWELLGYASFIVYVFGGFGGVGES